MFTVMIDKNKTHQSADQTQNTAEKQPNSRQNLEQRLVEQPPERVELLLGVRHVLELLLAILDALRDVAGEVLEDVGEVVLLGRRLARRRLVLGVGRDAAVGVEALNDALGLLEDAAALLDEGLHLADEGLLVPLVLGRALGLVDFLLHC